MRDDQSRADKLDEMMLELLLPESAVESLGRWLADPERGQRYANGSGPHSIPYTPSKWIFVAPWPSTFADRTAADSASVSRAEVVAAVRAAEQSESWAEAFVATQVWGYGVTGYGSYRTRQVLAQPSAEAVLTEAVSLLVDEGAVAAFEVLNTLDGLGPAFLTKFLYFAAQVLPDVKGPRPLILDSVLDGVLRRHATQTAPMSLRAELRASAWEFARAQRSQIRAEDCAAHALRSAARDIAHTATGPDGSALAALLAALVWATVIAQRWHEAMGHAQQAEAAYQAQQHLQAAADRAAAPVLAGLGARSPREESRRVLAHDVRAAVPDHADRILADDAWPALATLLADVEALGRKPHRLLKEAAAQRELGTARQPARVLIVRIQHTGRTAAPNRFAEASRRRTTRAWNPTGSPQPAPPVTRGAAPERGNGPRR